MIVVVLGWNGVGREVIGNRDDYEGWRFGIGLLICIDLGDGGSDGGMMEVVGIVCWWVFFLFFFVCVVIFGFL